MHSQQTTNYHQLLSWLNAHTHSLMEPTRSIASLWSGVAYLRLLSKLSPSVNIEAMIPDPTEHFEAAHNFKIIESIFLKMGIEFPLNIAKLADGSSWHNIRLLAFIRDTFKQGEHGSISLRIAQPKKEIRHYLAKEENTSITDEEISNALERVSAQDEGSCKKPNNEELVQLSQRINCQFSLQNSPERDIEDGGHLSQITTIYDCAPRLGTQENNILPRYYHLGCQRKSKWELDQGDYKVISTLICRYLQNFRGLADVQNEFNTILKKYLRIGRRVKSIDYLFYGSLKDEKQPLNEQKQADRFEGARKMIRKACIELFESTTFLRQLIRNQSFVRTKINILECLPNIIQLARMKGDQSNIIKCNSDLCKQCWSAHKRTLIAFQLLFINQKHCESKYVDKIFNRKGFLFEREQNDASTNVQKILKEYPNAYSSLHWLFQTDKNQRDLNRLKEFVRVMLQLKGAFFMRIFMEIYDCIMEKIREVFFQQINETDFMEAVDKISERIKCKAADLDEYLVKEYGMNSDFNAALKLIRVTVYCFLAERLSLRFNSFHQQTKLTTPIYNDQRQIQNMTKIQANKKQCNIQLDSLAKHRILNLKNERCQQRHKQLIIHHLNRFVIKCIEQMQISTKQTDKIKSLLQLMRPVLCDSYYLLQCFFIGKIKNPFNPTKAYREAAQITEKFVEARVQLENTCMNYFRSFQFIVNFMSHNYLQKNNILILLLKLLPDIELLPKLRWSFAQFFTLRYYHQTTYRSSANYSSNLGEKDPFWSDHRIVLIAFEARYILEKDVKRKLRLTKNKFSKSSALLLKKKVEVQNQTTIHQKAQQYTHLNNLFMDKDRQQLRQFVIGMLQLKHPSIIDLFLHAYDLIIREIINVELSHVYSTADRFKLIDEITERLWECGESIDSFLVKECGFADGLEGTMKLLRVTVYCFLAEMHSFTHNEFYCEAFTSEKSKDKERVELDSPDA